MLELTIGWGRKVVILHIDTEQVFDRLRHSTIMQALYAKKASRELVKATYQSLHGFKCRVRLGHTQSDWVQQDHGVPQGAPGFPIPMRPNRTWCEQSLSSIANCVTVLGNSDSE